jgi:phage regulator Rha-like protein
MKHQPEIPMIPDETLINKIYFIRNQKVMLDRDLATLYGIQTKRLKEQVRRNIQRFPKDFMFQLNKSELDNWRSQIATSNSEIMGLRYQPFAFTEHGILMLSSVLNSSRAIQVNIRIMRLFTQMRKMLLTNHEILLKVERMEKRMDESDEKVKIIFDYLKKLLNQPLPQRNKIGFQMKKGN